MGQHARIAWYFRRDSHLISSSHLSLNREGRWGTTDDFATSFLHFPVSPVSYAAVEEDCSSGLVVEVFDHPNKVGADVVLLHGCLQSCLPNPVAGRLEVYEDMVEVLLVLEIFLTEES